MNGINKEGTMVKELMAKSFPELLKGAYSKSSNKWWAEFIKRYLHLDKAEWICKTPKKGKKTKKAKSEIGKTDI